jgi:hypothetical protein
VTQKGRPYLAPALEQSKPKIRSMIEGAIKKAWVDYANSKR